ncbi:hypothetical protein BDW22DRAFT_1361352 [Trametopsis cervina]|nr:hypothetical protein BDW22DRAFT_1361352 [Trametopsis cervina]
MSTDGVATGQPLVLPHDMIDQWMYAHCALAGLIAYEHLITFGREIHCIWVPKWNRGTIIFLLTRYSLLGLGVVLFIQDRAPHGSMFRALFTRPLSCDVTERLYEGFILSICLMICVFSGLRASVIWNRSISVFVIAFTMLAVSAITYMVLFVNVSSTHVSVRSTTSFYCRAQYSMSDSTLQTYLQLLTHPLLVNLISRVCSLVGDAFVLTLTWIKTFGAFRVIRSSGVSASLTEYLLRDGTPFSFFSHRALTDILSLYRSLFALNICQLQVKNTALVVTLLHGFAAILICRFLLDLRVVHDAQLATSDLQTILVDNITAEKKD